MTSLRSPPQPKLLSWPLAAAICFGLAAVASYWTCDMPIARWFATSGFPGDIRRLVSAAEVFAYGGGVVCIILTAMALDARGARLGLFLLIYSLGAGMLADLAKLMLAKQRPYAADVLGPASGTWGQWLPSFSATDYGAHWQSFPSGHSATAVGLAIALSIAYPRGRWLFAAFAVLAMVQRLQANAHFLSDVLAAAALACAWCFLLQRVPQMSELCESPAAAPAATKTVS
jgi:membrane-associated phospholipid phosphatase